MTKLGSKLCLFNILLRLFNIQTDGVQPDATALCVYVLNSWERIGFIFVLDTKEKKEQQVIQRLKFYTNLHVQHEENVNFVGN